MVQLLDIFNSTGKWRYYNISRNQWKPILSAVVNNRLLYEFLVDNDYKLKSYNSADKILSKIPNSLHHYFFRGLIDGDGCFYLNK